MNGGIKRAACAAALVLAIAPAAAFASGGISGGGGGGGGGLNSGGGGTTSGGGGTTATRTELTATLVGAPMWRFATGTARYRDDGTRRTLSASVGWISSWAGRSLDLYVNGAFQASVVIPASGTPSYSADTNLGDSVPVLSAGADISWVMPDTLEVISEGTLD